MNKGVLNQALIEDIRKNVVEEVRRGVEEFEKLCVPQPEKIFDYTFATITPELQEQKDEFLSSIGVTDNQPVH